MQPKSTQQVYNEIVEHIKKQGGGYSSWYCGITSDWEACLFYEHKVPKNDYWYIARQCFSSEGARNVEADLLRLGCGGGGGGGDETTVYVYAYLKGTTTFP